MPANVVKTAEDEKLWNKAKQVAAEQGHEEEWDYIMGIFQKMKGKESLKEYVAGDIVKNKKGDIGIVHEVQVKKLNKVVFGDGKFITLEDDELVIINPDGIKKKLAELEEKENILEPQDVISFKKYGKSYHQLNGDQKLIIDKELGEQTEGVSSL